MSSHPRPFWFDRRFGESQNPILVIDSDLKIVYTNNRTDRLFTHTRSFKKAGSLRSLLWKHKGERWKSEILQAFSHPVFNFTLEFTQDSGILKPFEFRSARYTDGEGLEWLICIARDKTLPLATSRTRILRDISAELVSTKAPDELLQSLVQIMTKIPGVDHATITIYKELENLFEIVHEYPGSDTHPLQGERIPVEDRPTQIAIVQRRETVIVPFLFTHPLLMESGAFNRIAMARGINSLLILPMVFGDELVGTIAVDVIQDFGAFFPEEVEMFETISDLSAVAIHNSRMSSLRSILDVNLRLEDTGDQILHQLWKETRFTTGSFQELKDGNRTLVSSYGFEKLKADRWFQRPVSKDRLMRLVVASRSPLLIPDTTTDPRWTGSQNLPKVKSWMTVPIIHRMEVIALITLDHEIPGYFTKHHEDIVVDLLAIWAPSIRQAQMLDKVQNQLKSLDFLNQVFDTLGKKTGEDGLVKVIEEQMEKGLTTGPSGQYRQGIFFPGHFNDEKTQKIRPGLVPAGVGRESTLRPVPFSNTNGKFASPIEYVFQKGEGLVLANVNADSRFQWHPERKNPRPVVAAPIKISGKSIGVLSAFHEVPGIFGEAQLMLLDALARQAGIAIQRNTCLETLEKFGSQVMQVENLDEVLLGIATAVKKMTYSENSAVYLFNEACDAIINCVEPLGHPSSPRIGAGSAGLTRKLIDNPRLHPYLALVDTATYPAVNPQIVGRYKSIFGMPLKSGGKIIGVFYAFSHGRHEWSEAEIKFLSILASLAASFIKRFNQEVLYQSLVDNSPYCIFRKDTEGRVTFASRSYLEYEGWSPEHVLGKTDFDLFDSSVAAYYRQADLDVLRTGKGIDRIEPHGMKNGLPVQVHVIKTPIRDAHGKIHQIQGMFKDVTLEEQHKEASARYESLVDFCPNGILVHQNSKIIRANQAAATLLDLSSPDKLLGLDFQDLIQEDYRAMALSRVSELLEGSQVFHGQKLKIIQPQNPDMHIDVEVFSRPTEKIGEIQVVIHDLTPSKNLINDMHHRLMRWLKEVTRKIESIKAAHSPGLNDDLENLHKQVMAMCEVQSLLTRRPDVPIVVMGPKVRQLAEQIFGAIDRSDVELHVDADEVRLASGTASLCLLVIAELMVNSLVHGFRGTRGIIAVVMKIEDGKVKLDYSDDGRGLPFENDVQQGKGISIVNNIIHDQLKGRVSRESGNGLKYRMSFPL